MGRSTPVAVIAPHGGSVEAGTLQIAEAISGEPSHSAALRHSVRQAFRPQQF
jgi:phage replication-related protein YjqB (UPF0714/DUF867 family)